MSIKIASLSLALAIAAATAPIAANARAYIDIDIAPPAPREEIVLGPRRGYEWSPGYWNWSGHRHVWVSGRTIRSRHGHHWVGDRWEQRGSRWHHDRGHWD